MQETQVRSLGQEDPLEKGIATHSSILAWRIPWTVEPGGLWSTGLRRVRCNWSDLAQLMTCCVITLLLPQGCCGFQKSHPHPPRRPLSVLITHSKSARLSSAPPHFPASTNFPALNPLVLLSCSIHSKNWLTHHFLLSPNQGSPQTLWFLNPLKCSVNESFHGQRLCVKGSRPGS